MPRVPVDYSKTVVYTITSADGKVFVGHTTNITQRKAHLKLISTNLDSNDEESQFIKKHGGFLAVKIAPVKSIEASSAVEAKIAAEQIRKELVKESHPTPAPRKSRKVPVVVQELKPEPVPPPFELLKPEVVLDKPVPVVIKKLPKHESVEPAKRIHASTIPVQPRTPKKVKEVVPAPPAPEPAPEPAVSEPAPAPVKKGRPKKVVIA